MDILPRTSEITESCGEAESKIDEKGGKYSSLKRGNGCSVEDDINRLFEAINIRTSAKSVGFLHDDSKGNLQKRAMKRPMRHGSPQISGIGISEPVSLKQALRGLCISQASEMAAMKRLSTTAGSSRVSEASAIKRLYRSVVVEASGSGLPLNEGKDSLVEFALVPETTVPNYSEKVCESLQIGEVELSKDSNHFVKNLDVSYPVQSIREMSHTEVGMLNCTGATCTAAACETLSETDASASAPVAVSSSVENLKAEEPENSFGDPPSPSISAHGSAKTNSSNNNVRFLKPIFRNKNFIKQKVKRHLAPASSSSTSHSVNATQNLDDTTSVQSKTHGFSPENGREEHIKASTSSSSLSQSVAVNPSIRGNTSCKQGSSSSTGNRTRSILGIAGERSRSREKGEFSQSSKSSIGQCSSSTSVSENSSLSESTLSSSGNRPHMSRDLRWEAIRRIQKQHGTIGLKHFKMIKKLGCGDIGSVYLAELTGTNCFFALKVMDNEFLASREKMARAQTEREILKMLDHPFLPTLYANFVSDKLSCLVTEYCPCGDLHVLRQKQLNRCFSEQAVRFYVAEVLLTLEYLHMLGVVYRDLKPENILVREDGHIMLSDFDLSLRCSGNPILLKSSSPDTEPPKRVSSPYSVSGCIEPLCLNPGWQVSCFSPRLLSVTAKSRKLKTELACQVSPLPQLVVEPTDARSNSFVGTYEYLAPEIIKSEGHGSAVDWWTFGIFLFELLYGKTPFKGSGNDETLSNIVSRSLRFPTTPIVSVHARDLIRGLLIKEPENRLGSTKGAAEIKQHPFFEGLNWALIRCALPPELPEICGPGTPTPLPEINESINHKEPKGTEEFMEFEMF